MWRIESRFEMLGMSLRPDEFARFINTFGNTAYHYTVKKNVESILTNGLDPQHSRLNSPTEKFGQVYLFMSGHEPEWLIFGANERMSRLAINLNALDPAKLMPDDDLLLTLDDAWDTVDGEWPEILPEAQEGDTLDSMWHTGQFAYKGPIPPEAIKYDGDVDESDIQGW